MAGANRLQLDFKLATDEERAAFLERYLQRAEFIDRPPTEEELETMGNYILWGKDPTTGLNAKQTGLIKMETKHGTWDHNSRVESLEGLMESPSFNEASLVALDTPPIKLKREIFSRKETLQKCPEYLRETFEGLFAQIDEIDLMINYYELECGRRKNPPRDLLLNKFSEERREELRAQALLWPQYTYLKMRHQLVDLRRQQYTLRDSFQNTVLTQVTPLLSEETNIGALIDSDIEILPLGTKNNSELSALLFRDWTDLVPENYSQEEIALTSKFYWEKKGYAPTANSKFLDFREVEHVYQMLLMFFDLEDSAANASLESNMPALMQTLLFYVDRAELTELQREILDLKIRKVRNGDIADIVNQKWGKTYTPNYISTIFRQRIIPRINDAAVLHGKLVESLPFKEDFKICTRCGRTLLRDACNFTRKSRSKDGFMARCKKCEKEARAN